MVKLGIFCQYIVIFLLTTHNLSAQSPQDYEQANRAAYTRAREKLREQAPLIAEVLGKHAAILIPAVFPEMVRYSATQDWIETSSLEMLYVRFGKQYANFSVGNFQMKPAFAEQIEEMLRAQGLTQFATLYTYPDTELQAIRRARVRRLVEWQGQLHYLAAFYHLLRQRLELTRLSREDLVRFVAAAYNRGFTQPEAEIRRWQSIRAFPHGSAYWGRQYAYSEIALDFAKRYYWE